MIQVGIRVADAGAAVVTIDHGRSGAVVTGIERLPFDLEAVIALVGDLGGEPQLVIDAEGLGTALWAAVRGRRTQEGARWRLFSDRGLDRQRLVDVLVVAVHEGSLHFAAGLAHQEAMSRALVAYRRQVGEDGQIGSELVVALCLALSRPVRRGGMAFVA